MKYYITDGKETEPVSNCACYNYEDIVTPVNVDILQELLEEVQFDLGKRSKLIDGFKYGFEIGCRGNLECRNVSCNIPFTVGNKTDMWNKIMKEVDLNRYARPYEESEIPFTHFVQLPIGLVPKSGGKTRLIFHLSYNFSNEDQSINANTPKDLCSVRYKELDFAIEGLFCMVIWLGYRECVEGS